MDNAAFRHSDRIIEMCAAAGVKLMYLPPYSPEVNPTEEFFSELKAFIRRHWRKYEQCPLQGFDIFLESCIEYVGSRKESAVSHFRHAGVVVENYH